MLDWVLEVDVMAVCKRRFSALPVLTYKTYAALRFSKPTIFDAPDVNLSAPVLAASYRKSDGYAM